MADTEKTERGFGIYGRIPTRNGGTLRVQQSSLAFEGAHVWLFLDGEKCVDHRPTGTHLVPAPHLSVAQAEQVIAALSEFVRQARANELNEPAECPDDPEPPEPRGMAQPGRCAACVAGMVERGEPCHHRKANG